MNKKSTLIVFICIMLLFSNISTNTYAKSRPRLEKKKVLIYKNKTKVIKLKNVKGKVKWKVRNRKIVRIIKIKGKYNNSIKVKGKNKGKTKIIAIYKHRKYVVNINVKQKKKEPVNNIDKKAHTTVTEETTTAIPNETIISPVKENQLEIVNNPIKINDDMKLELKVTNNSKVSLRLTYHFGKLEKLENGVWEQIQIKEYCAIEPLIFLESNESCEFTININKEAGSSYVFIENLKPGHYRYSHYEDITESRYISGEFDIVE
mgnify:FL=1